MMVPQKASAIDRTKLDGGYYFASLLSEGQQCGLVTERDVERIQAESLSLLEELNRKWSRNGSSSLRVERAQQFLDSVFYVTGVSLKEFPTPEDALEALKREGLAALWKKGLKDVQRQIQIARFQQEQLKRNLFSSENEFYRSTVVDGMNGFFRQYQPEFAAHEIPITVDYPTFLPIKNVKGIEYIRRYLKYISYENQFCLRFAPERVHRLLCGFHENYTQIPMNLYEPVLATALGCVLNGMSVENLYCDISVMRNLFAERSAAEIAELLRNAADWLAGEWSFSAGLTGYLQGSVPQIAKAVERGILLGHLETVILKQDTPLKTSENGL